MNQGYINDRLVIFLTKFIAWYQDLVDKYSTSQMIHEGLQVLILGTDVVNHLKHVLYYSFICFYGYFFYCLICFY